MTTEKATNANREHPVDGIGETYSVFTTIEKWCIVALASYAAWMSTLSSFIYFPAIPTLSRALGVSVHKIDLTVTTYMAVATIAPMLVGDAAEKLGRRPVYAVILAIYFVANLAIALTETYQALLALRALQALAISGTFSIAYGVVVDVATPAERGSFAALVSFAVTTAPSIGPVLGGSLTSAAGWPWIFWFLCIISGSCLAAMLFLLPETSRNIVGNGSIRPLNYLWIPSPLVMRHWEVEETSPTHAWRVPNPFQSLMILRRKDNAIIIVACGLLYAVYTCINASLSTLFVNVYHLNQLEAGLIYLPFGIGGALSTFVSGRLLNRAWRAARTRRNLPTDKVAGDDLDSFPVEKARLQVIWMPMFVTAGSIITYGWVLHYRKPIAISLSLQFVAGFCMQLDFSVYNTLLVDKNSKEPVVAQASSNIVRCSLAALAVSFVQRIID
ncbi:MFS general substrate transporter, partial [Decorospora gaudefroyi]